MLYKRINKHFLKLVSCKILRFDFWVRSNFVSWIVWCVTFRVLVAIWLKNASNLKFKSEYLIWGKFQAITINTNLSLRSTSQRLVQIFGNMLHTLMISGINYHYVVTISISNRLVRVTVTFICHVQQNVYFALVGIFLNWDWILLLDPGK